jgi:hypothetical protein
MQAFIWRSTHGKLYGKRDLFRFNYGQDPHCEWCEAKKQNIVHIFTECPCVQSLFANFNRQYHLEDALTTPEKEIGFDTNTPRSRLTIKRLAILREHIYDCVHSGATPKWETVLHQIDVCYIIEYAIEDRSGTKS